MVLGLLDQLQIFTDLQICRLVSDGFIRTFNRSRATQAVALAISKAFNRVWNFRLDIWSYLQSCMEYACHIWAGALSCFLELLDKLQKQIYRTVGLSLAAFL